MRTEGTTVWLSDGQTIKQVYSAAEHWGDGTVGWRLGSTVSLYRADGRADPVGRAECAHCGQWGEPRSACEYCGAPVGP